VDYQTKKTAFCIGKMTTTVAAAAGGSKAIHDIMEYFECMSKIGEEINPWSDARPFDNLGKSTSAIIQRSFEFWSTMGVVVGAVVGRIQSQRR